MRILNTTHSYPPAEDGVAQVVGNIAERLARLGHEVHVATSALQGEPARETRNGVQVRRFAASGTAVTGMRGDIDAYRSFVRCMEWDVIVNHCIQHWAFDALLDVLEMEGSRHVLVTHGMRADPGGYGPYHTRLADLIPRLGAWACVSPVTEEREFSRQFELDDPVLLQNGITLGEWLVAPRNVRDEWQVGKRPWILNVSNHAPLKGHRTYHSLPGRLRLPDVRFTLIGRGYPMARMRLGRFGVRGGCWYSCHGRAFLSGVELRSSATRDQTVSAIIQSDVVVATSQHEANSIVLLEAMAAGTPWVSLDVGSAAANAGGCVVKTETELAACLAELIESADLRAQLGEAGRRSAAERHSWDKIVLQYDALLRRVAAGSVAQRS